MLGNLTRNKDLILMYLGDNSGCSHVRCRFFADYINASNLGFKVAILPVYTFDPRILSRTKAIIWQKCVGYASLNELRRYKGIQSKFGFKLIYEIDDLFFNPTEEEEGMSELPKYNIAFLRRFKNKESVEEIEKTIKDIIPMFDTIMTSTDYLGNVIKKRFHHPNVVTVKNTVPRFLWSCPKKEPRSKDIEIPTILYSGASGHYLNPSKEEEIGDRGDWDNNLGEWIIKNVRDDKIRLTMMGDFPYFLKDLSYKINFIGWANSYNYPRRAWNTGADFQIAPLVENDFNYCKSALRFYESSISGMGFLGSTFGNPYKIGPYDEIYPKCKIDRSMELEEIDEVMDYLKHAENYNAMIEWQYNYLEQNGHILESEMATNKFLSVVDINVTKIDQI